MTRASPRAAAAAAVAARKRSKVPAPALPVPQSDVEAAAAVARIGETMREIERLKADGDDRIAAIAAETAALTTPLRARLDAETEGLKVYCDANRLRLAGAAKTIKFETGVAGWRVRPAKVTLRDKLDDILARLETLGLGRFVRTKKEVDKEAMLREPDVARSVGGVSIGSAGEDFHVEPLGLATPTARPLAPPAARQEVVS